MTGIRLFALLLASLTLSNAWAASPAKQRGWDFTVYLDDDPVGRHQFVLTESEAMRELRSEARFVVKILSIPAYSYDHQASEVWRGDCLTDIKARTDDNGDKTVLSGSSHDGQFDLKKENTALQLPACIMTFAYWNPLMLKQSHLLNPQTGDYLPVSFETKGRDEIQVRGRPVSADRYHLDAGKFQIDLWYDKGDWVALDSTLSNGSRLRYRIN